VEVKSPIYLRILIAFLIIGVLVTGISLLVHFNLIAKAAAYISEKELGWLGWVYYLILCIVASVLLIPQTPVEAAAGVIWSDSFAKAFIAAYLGKQLGSWVCFAIGRFSARRIDRRLERTLSGHPIPPPEDRKKSQAVLLLEATTRVFQQKPHTLTFLACAASIPAWIKNYGLASIPDVSFWRHFMPWTAVCGIFYSVANVLIGISVSGGTIDDETDDDIPDEKRDTKTSKVVMFAMTGVTFAGILTIAFFTKRELNRQIKELDKEQEERKYDERRDDDELLVKALV